MIEEHNPTLVGFPNSVRVAEWVKRMGKRPNGIDSSVQAGVMIEEMVELFETFVIASPSGVAANLLTESRRLLHEVATQLKMGEAFLYVYDRELAVDAMADIKVTIDGTGSLMAFDMEKAHTKVVDSLFRKFNPDGSPVILPGGKIGKAEGWVAPDLSDCLGTMEDVPDAQQPFILDEASPAQMAAEIRRQVLNAGPNANPSEFVAPMIHSAMLVAADRARSKMETSLIAGNIAPHEASLVGLINSDSAAASSTIAVDPQP